MSALKGTQWRVGFAVGGVCLAVASGVLVWSAWQYGLSRHALDAGVERLAALYERGTFPSPENVSVLTDAVEAFAFQMGELEGELRRDPFPKEVVEPADFSAAAQRSVERFRLKAEAADVALSEGIEGGFKTYVSGGTLPEFEQVPRLSRQLYSVERLADLLIGAGVHSIERLSREPFEEEQAQELELRRGRRGRQAAHSKRSRRAIRLLGSRLDETGLFAVERVEALFMAQEAQVWQVLDALASAPHFMTLVEISTETQSDILSFNPEKVKSAGEGDDETLQYLASGILKGEQALSRPERMIAGDEQIRVRMVVDVYNFESLNGPRQRDE